MPRHLLVLLCVTVSSLTGVAGADGLQRVLQAYQRGQYEEVIRLATDALDSRQPQPEAYHYLRGMAAFRIAWFGQAEEDLAPLAARGEGGAWGQAADLVARIRRSRELAPRNVREVVSGRRVVFRVYFDEDDKWTGALFNALDDTYRVVCDLYGIRPVETAVFVFADQDRHTAFAETLTGQELSSWAWASGGNGMLLFCPYAPGNDYRESPSQLPECTAHEYSHCVTHRVLGNAAMPMWLDEGLAMHCGALVRDREVEDNDLALTRMWTAKQILPLRAVTERNTFYDEQIAPYAYTQAYAMVRFLMSELQRDGLLEVLNNLKHGGNFNAAMEDVWGGNVDAFYEDWLAATQRRVQKFK
ncbi:hypothetical protein LLH23_22795 [bacterium]|nr:hypothetical protein [bacterium]